MYGNVPPPPMYTTLTAPAASSPKLSNAVADVERGAAGKKSNTLTQPLIGGSTGESEKKIRFYVMIAFGVGLFLLTVVCVSSAFYHKEEPKPIIEEEPKEIIKKDYKIFALIVPAVVLAFVGMICCCCGEWTVTPPQAGGKKLGAEFGSASGSGGSALVIDKIFDGGSLEAWNREHPGKAVKPGHRIVAVNGTRGSSDVLMKALMKVLSDEEQLKLAVKR